MIGSVAQHVHDIAQACVSIVWQLLKPNKTGVYHYAGQPDVSWCQLANAIFEKSGCQTVASILTSDYPTPARRPLNSRLNCVTHNDVWSTKALLE